MSFKSLLAAVVLATAASAQLSGSVGPTTPLSKKTHICNVLDYGGSIGSSDIGPAIASAFNVGTSLNFLSQARLRGSSDTGRTVSRRTRVLHCTSRLVCVHILYTQTCWQTDASDHLALYLGNYSMKTWVGLSHGTNWAFRLDGLITRTGTFTSFRVLYDSTIDEIYR